MDVQMPDGTIITGVPDNMTKAELAAKYKNNTYTSGVSEDASMPESSYSPKSKTGAYLEDVIKRYYANAVGFPLDIIHGAMGYDVIGGSVPKPSEALSKFIGVQDIKPPSEETKMLGTVLGNVAASVPYALGGGTINMVKEGLGSGAKAALNQLFIGTRMGIGSTMGQAAAPDNPYAEAAGQIGGGLFPSLAMVTRLRSGSVEARQALQEAAKKSGQVNVGEDIRKAISPLDPNAVRQQLADYEALKQSYPGLNVGVGDILENNTLQSLQRQTMGRNSQFLTEAGTRARANQAALEAAKEGIVPQAPVSITGAIRGQKQLLSADQQAISNQLTALDAKTKSLNAQISDVSMNQQNAGESLNAYRGDAFNLSRQIATQKYADFTQAVQPIINKPVAAGDIMGTIHDLRNEHPADSMPMLFRKVDQLVQTKTAQKPQYPGPAGAFQAAQAPSQDLSINDLLSIQKAASADIRHLQSSAVPDRPAIRRLTMLNNQVDQAISKNVPPEIGQLYDSARDYYRNEHAPRFFEGVNYKQALANSYGDPRIMPDKLVTTYISNPTNAAHFNDLYGNNEAAKAVLHAGVMDLYNAKVIEGNMSPATFSRNYSLDKFPWIAKDIADKNTAFEAIAANKQILQDQAGNLAKSRIASILKTDTPDQVVGNALQSPQNMGNLMLRMPAQDRQAVVTAVMDQGWQQFEKGGSAGLQAWVDQNQLPLRTMLTGAFGKTMAEEHMQRIADQIKVARMVEQSPVQQINASAVKGAEDPMQEATHSSWSSIWAAARAVAQRRTSPEFTAGIFAGKFLTGEAKDAYYNMLHEQLYDPQALRNYMNTAAAPTQANWKSWISKSANTAYRIYGPDIPKIVASRIPFFGVETRSQQQDQQ